MRLPSGPFLERLWGDAAWLSQPLASIGSIYEKTRAVGKGYHITILFNIPEPHGTRRTSCQVATEEYNGKYRPLRVPLLYESAHTRQRSRLHEKLTTGMILPGLIPATGSMNQICLNTIQPTMCPAIRVRLAATTATRPARQAKAWLACLCESKA